MDELNLYEPVTTHAKKVLNLLEKTAKRSGVPTSCYYLAETQRDRIITALENVFPKIFKQIPCIGRLYMPACLAIASCAHSLTPDTVMNGSAGVASAIWMRDHVDQTSYSMSKISAMFDSDSFLVLPTEVPKTYNIDHDPQLLLSFVKAVTNRLAPLHFQYDKSEAEQRHGPSYEIYAELKATVPPAKIKEAEETFIDRFNAYLEVELKIVKLILLKYENSLKCRNPYNPVLCMQKASEVPPVLFDYGQMNQEDYLLSALFAVTGLPLLINGAVPNMKNLDAETREKVKKIVMTFDPLHTSDGRDVDPYTIAFGYQSLLDKNDDIAYLPGISCGLVGLYADMLPWVRKNREPMSERTELPAWCRESNSIYAFKSWIPSANNKKTGSYANPAQILYDYDSTVSSTHEVDTAKVTQGTGMDNCHEQPAVSISEVPDKHPNDDAPEIHDEFIKLKNENECLCKEIAVVKKNLNRSEHERKAAEKQINELRTQTDLYLVELRELRNFRKLRETPFYQESLQNGNIKQKDDSYQYPCPVKKKIVVYGGQDTWKSAIDKMIPGIKFAQDSKHVDTDLIIHADAIWVQTYAISHSVYKTVRDCAKKNGIPMHIFTSKGVSNCAAQLARCAVG